MKCKKCGADIQDGVLYCSACGEELRIDYNALDEMIAAHVRDGIETEPEQTVVPEQTENRQNSGKKKLLILPFLFLVTFVIGFTLYQSTYEYQMKKGYQALKKKHYDSALRYFESAAVKEPAKTDAFIGLSEVYIRQGNLQAAEHRFRSEIEAHPENTALYRGLVMFYEKTGQEWKIPVFLEECGASVLSALKDYAVELPEFSLREEFYEEEQNLVFSAGDNTVYYTLDGSEPTAKNGVMYRNPVALGEGRWHVRAIAVNERGIPSRITEHRYTVEIPLSDPPIVYPSTGLYENKQKITIQVPEGMTAYYIFGKTIVTPETGKKYTGPIQMPEGNLLFSAVLVDDKSGKVSGTTVRNYDLKLNPVSEEDAK